jgi:hypothetical protein
MPAECSIDACGVSGTGRCADRKRAFCSSHGVPNWSNPVCAVRPEPAAYSVGVKLVGATARKLAPQLAKGLAAKAATPTKEEGHRGRV